MGNIYSCVSLQRDIAWISGYYYKIFCICKNLLNKKKSLKDSKIIVLNSREKILVEGNLPQSWPWKLDGTGVVAALMSLEVVNNWRSMLKNVTVTTVEWLVSTWSLYFIEIPQEKHLKLSDYLNEM